MSNAVDEFKTKLNPLLLRLSQSQRLPQGLLLYGENQASLFAQMKQLSEEVNGTSFSIENLDLSDIQEPTADIIIIGSKQSIKIDTVKQLQERIKYGATTRTYCIILIYECEKLTLSAANALLKILEEPQPNTLFIFSTTNKHLIPKTILSECFNDHKKRIQNCIDEISQQISMLDVQSFLSLPVMDQAIWIQSLPYDPSIIKNVINIWVFQLGSQKETLRKKELFFLQKMIEIIHNIKYNLNLKLQLMAVTLQIEEESK
ncbi:MAG: hypothetical protein VW397_04570 [Candidatus Margulisiibacteriota bacterium]